MSSTAFHELAESPPPPAMTSRLEGDLIFNGAEKLTAQTGASEAKLATD